MNRKPGQGLVSQLGPSADRSRKSPLAIELDASAGL